MNKEHGKLWIEALRSDQYDQTRNQLVEGSKANGTDRYCCLGVAGCLARSTSYFSIGLWLGISGSIRQRLINLNDVDKKSFPEIADWIEENLLGEGE